MIRSFKMTGLMAAFVVGGGAAAAAFQYPVAGSDGDPDFCSSRSEPVMFCVTPPPDAHCQALISEETPLYLGYRYSCEPVPLATPARRAPVAERAP